jgi:hypothetical protein
MLMPISTVLALALCATPSLPAGVKVGDLVNYKFREAPLNAGGVQSMQDLRGTPVLIEFWGTH